MANPEHIAQLEKGGLPGTHGVPSVTFTSSQTSLGQTSLGRTSAALAVGVHSFEGSLRFCRAATRGPGKSLLPALLHRLARGRCF